MIDQLVADDTLSSKIIIWKIRKSGRAGLLTEYIASHCHWDMGRQTILLFVLCHWTKRNVLPCLCVLQDGMTQYVLTDCERIASCTSGASGNCQTQISVQHYKGTKLFSRTRVTNTVQHYEGIKFSTRTPIVHMKTCHLTQH
jgi:hypothetical protein